MSRASSLPRALPLFEGLPARDVALQRQKANLVQFHNDNAAAFAAMPYEPWTVVPPNAGFDGLKFEQRPAEPPLRGLRGVFPLQSVPARSKPRRLLFYPGLLIPAPLYEVFSAQYFCPTGLNLPALEYRTASGAKVPVLILGDPTSLGAMVNDGRFGREEGQNALAAARARSVVRSFLTLALLVCCFAPS